MTSPAIPPRDADPAAVVADFERRARVHGTPCGAGVMVWRAWGEGPPVLLAHGSHGAWSHWIRNIDALAADRTVWAPDLPCYGDSAMAPEPDHPGFAGVVAAGMRQLMAPDLPVDIVGFSFGGVMATHLAALHPDLVRRLVLVDVGGLGTPLGQVHTERVRGLDGEARRAALRANLLGLMLHSPDSVDELALHLQAKNGFRGRFNPGHLVMPNGVLDALPQVTAQVDAIWGACDGPHPDPPAQETALRRLRPDMEFRVIPGAGALGHVRRRRGLQQRAARTAGATSEAGARVLAREWIAKSASPEKMSAIVAAATAPLRPANSSLPRHAPRGGNRDRKMIRESKRMPPVMRQFGMVFGCSLYLPGQM
jgi:pimeloyl-ACP methyl ester carboxylesterase